MSAEGTLRVKRQIEPILFTNGFLLSVGLKLSQSGRVRLDAFYPRRSIDAEIRSVIEIEVNQDDKMIWRHISESNDREVHVIYTIMSAADDIIRIVEKGPAHSNPTADWITF